MTTRPCRAKNVEECRVHGTTNQIAVVTAACLQAVADHDIDRYLDLKEELHQLEKIAARALLGSRPRDAVHPVIVYGTLRPTGTNYGNFMKGLTNAEEEIELEGFSMYDGQGFPFLTQGGEGKVTATLVYLNEDSYRDAMDGLDFLEGFKDDDSPDNYYDRVLHTFEVDGKEVTAWIYVASPSVAHYAQKNLPVIGKGDWLKHNANRFEDYLNSAFKE